MAATPLYNVIVSDRARKMLGLHIRFLANLDAAAARKVQSEIMKAVRSLATMPGRFPFLCAESIPPNKYHKMYVENWYLVLYQIKDQTVYVDYIIDCRQDYAWLLE